MKKYYDYCLKYFDEVEYISSSDKNSDITVLLDKLSKSNVAQVKPKTVYKEKPNYCLKKDVSVVLDRLTDLELERWSASGRSHIRRTGTM